VLTIWQALSSGWIAGRGAQLDVVDPSPAGRSEQALLNISRDISFREQFLKVRELRIQLTLRPWPIAGPHR